MRMNIEIEINMELKLVIEMRVMRSSGALMTHLSSPALERLNCLGCQYKFWNGDHRCLLLLGHELLIMMRLSRILRQPHPSCWKGMWKVSRNLDHRILWGGVHMYFLAENLRKIDRNYYAKIFNNCLGKKWLQYPVRCLIGGSRQDWFAPNTLWNSFATKFILWFSSF